MAFPEKGEIKYTSYSFNSSGANTMLAAVSGMKLRVLKMTMKVAGTVTVTLRSFTTTATGRLVGAQAYITADGIVRGGGDQIGWFESRSGESINCLLSAGVQTGGEIVYQEVPTS